MRTSKRSIILWILATCFFAACLLLSLTVKRNATYKITQGDHWRLQNGRIVIVIEQSGFSQTWSRDKRPFWKFLPYEVVWNNTAFINGHRVDRLCDILVIPYHSWASLYWISYLLVVVLKMERRNWRRYSGRCVRCGYIIHGIATDICSECGLQLRK